MININQRGLNLIKVFGFLLITALLAVVFIFLANIKQVLAEEAAPVCSAGNVITEEGYLDFADIGNLKNEAGRALLGWSEANMNGNYGGCERGALCDYRQAWEPVCQNGNNSATVSLNVPEKYFASAISIRHLDGIGIYGSFKMYVNNNLVLEYKDTGGSVEKWMEKETFLHNLEGVLVIRIEATDSKSFNCGEYGQLAIDWIGIKGYTCETGSISGCIFNDSDGNGIIEDGGEAMPDWDIILEHCSDITINEDGISEFNSNVYDICAVIEETVTDPLGCYEFIDVDDGLYKVKEVLKDGWTQTYPLGANYNIEIRGGDTVLGIDFANFKGEIETVMPNSVCGNEIVEYYEECDGQGDVNEGFYCTEICTLVVVEEIISILDEIPEVGGNDEEIAVLGEAGIPNLTIGKIILNQNENNSNLIEEKIFKVVVANNGSITAFGVNVVDNLPEGLVFAGTDESTKAWFLGDIEPGKIKNITYLVEIKDSASPGVYTNVAEVFASNHSPVTATADIIVSEIEPQIEPREEIIPEAPITGSTEILGEEGEPELIITKTADRKIVNMGSGLVEYTIIITNKGNLTAFAATLVDTLYGGLVHSDTGEAIKTWNLGDIEPGITKTIKYSVDVGTVDTFGAHSNTAVVFASNHDPISATSEIEVKESNIAFPMGGGNIIVDVQAKLSETGFSNKEFILLLGVIMILFGVTATLRKGYYNF